MTHAIFSQDLDQVIKWYDVFDKTQIKNDIKQHLINNPKDIIEHCKTYNEKDIKKYYGLNIINFYQCNPNTNIPSLCITKRNKTYYKTLS